MIRALNVAEHNVFSDPPRVVVVPAATATEALPNEQGKDSGEIAYRYIQNVGANPCYYSFGLSNGAGGPQCDATINFHGYLAVGQQLDCSNHRQKVCVYSTGGTTLATTLMRRRDLTA